MEKREMEKAMEKARGSSRGSIRVDAHGPTRRSTTTTTRSSALGCGEGGRLHLRMEDLLKVKSPCLCVSFKKWPKMNFEEYGRTLE